MEFNFEKLHAWKESKALVVEAYKKLKTFPVEERYALCDQIRRSSVSVPSNVVERVSRTSPKEKVHFINTAYGSLMELFCQFSIAHDLGYITREELEEMRLRVAGISKLLSGLKSAFESNR